MVQKRQQKPPVFKIPKIPFHPNSQHPGGLVRIQNEESFAKQFITASPAFGDALRKSKMLDMNQLLSIVELEEYFETFNTRGKMNSEILKLNNFVNGTFAVGGYGVAHGIMAHDGIVSPEAMGVSLDKQQLESLKLANKEKQKQMERQDNSQGQRPP